MPKFEKPTKEQWLSKVEKDLKGKPLTDLEWQAGGVNLSAIYSLEDTIQSATTKRSDNVWLIGQQIAVTEAAAANSISIDALEKGVNALFISCDDANQLPSVLKDIQLEWIHTHISTADTNVIGVINRLIQEQQYDSSKVSISLDLLGHVSSEHVGSLHAKNATVLYLRSEKRQPIQVIADLLGQANECIKKLVQDGVSHVEACQTVRLAVTMTDAYYENIAMLRALKSVWSLFTSEWCGETLPLKVDAVVRHEDPTTDPNHNTIKSTAQALSAVIGGVEALCISPSDSAQTAEGSNHSRRIARNINHLLMQESHLHLVADPAAGSYFLEHLTQEVAKESWRLFQDHLQ